MRPPPVLAWLLPTLLLIVALHGCGVLPRNAVPADKLDAAIVPGFEDVRVWGDGDPAVLERWFAARIARERNARGLGPDDPLPPATMLAISGGGMNGAYSAGLLCGWTEHGDRPRFNVITGVSAGALIAPFVFAGPDYDHVLRDVFTGISTKDVAEARNIFSGIIGESLYFSTPLRTLLERNIDEVFLARIASEYRSGRSLMIATTNLDSQRPVIWTMGPIAERGGPEARRLFIDILVASASIPGVFPPVYIDVDVAGRRYNEMHVDGGATAQVFVYPPAVELAAVSVRINATRERTVYVIRNSGINAPYQPVRRRTLAIVQRAVSSLIESQGVGDLYRIYLEAQRDGLAFRMASIPPEVLRPTTEFFDTALMNELFNAAYERAKAGYPWRTAPPGFEAPGSPHAP